MGLYTNYNDRGRFEPWISRLKIPIGANESELQHFCHTKQLFYDHTLTIYMSQSVRVKDNYFHINIIFFIYLLQVITNHIMIVILLEIWFLWIILLKCLIRKLFSYIIYFETQFYQNSITIFFVKSSFTLISILIKLNS